MTKLFRGILKHLCRSTGTPPFALCLRLESRFAHLLLVADVQAPKEVFPVVFKFLEAHDAVEMPK